MNTRGVSLLLAIVDRGRGDAVCEMAGKAGAHLKVVIQGEGTATSQILSMLGLEQTEKDVCMCALFEGKAGPLLAALAERMQLRRANAGVACLLSLDGVAGQKTLDLLLGKDAQDMTQGEGRAVSAAAPQGEYDLIVTIVDRGFAEDVMDAARQAGAQGGTVVHARGSGIHETERFFGIAIQPEKEIVLILIARDSRHSVMKAVSEKAGLATPGKGIAFSLPVDDVAGITHLMK